MWIKISINLSKELEALYFRKDHKQVKFKVPFYLGFSGGGRGGGTVAAGEIVGGSAGGIKLVVAVDGEVKQDSGPAIW